MELVKGKNVMSKTTGLAAFTRKNNTLTQETDQETLHVRNRNRGKGEKVALTVRLSRAKWERVHQLAVAEGVSIQALAIEGLSKIFTEKGLPALDE